MGAQTCIIRCGMRLLRHVTLGCEDAWRTVAASCDTLSRDRMAHGCCTFMASGGDGYGFEIPVAGREAVLSVFAGGRARKRKACSSPGCGFAAQFPRTLEALKSCAPSTAPWLTIAAAVLSASREGWKTLSGFAGKLGRRLERLGTREVIVVCPNCQRHMRETLDVSVVSIYRKLEEWGVASGGLSSRDLCFILVQSRERPVMWPDIEPLVAGCELAPVAGVPCCGLRGDIAARGPEPCAESSARKRRVRSATTRCTCTGVVRRSVRSPRSARRAARALGASRRGRTARLQAFGEESRGGENEKAQVL